MKYDLEERVQKFGEDIIRFAKKIKRDSISDVLIKQLVRSGTSIGANYMEANQASSGKDFRNKIFICKKEANETKHWLRMISSICDEDCCVEQKRLWGEAHEFVLIFATISKKSV